MWAAIDNENDNINNSFTENIDVFKPGIDGETN